VQSVLRGSPTDRDLGSERGSLLLAVLQLPSGLVSLKLGLRLQLVKGILVVPVLLQELLPLQPGIEKEIYIQLDIGILGEGSLVVAIYLFNSCHACHSSPFCVCVLILMD